MSITKVITHRVDVVFDARAWELFGDKRELQFEIEEATRGNNAAGSYPDSDGERFWAEFLSYDMARRCNEKLQAVADRWSVKAERYDRNKDQP